MFTVHFRVSIAQINGCFAAGYATKFQFEQTAGSTSATLKLFDASTTLDYDEEQTTWRLEVL